MRAFNEKQVIEKIIVGILSIINKVEFSIYMFLVLDTKNTKKWSHSIEFQFNQLTSCWTLNTQ